jgi:hypothetical protein
VEAPLPPTPVSLDAVLPEWNEGLGKHSRARIHVSRRMREKGWKRTLVLPPARVDVFLLVFVGTIHQWPHSNQAFCSIAADEKWDNGDGTPFTDPMEELPVHLQASLSF